jgi:amino acid adenylation domain-containing protein
MTHPPRTIHGLVAEWSRTTPHAVAIRSASRVLTYAQLDDESDRLARQLLAAGVRTGTAVGVVGTRSANFIVGVLGVLKAGGYFIPVDPDHPVERQRLILDDAGARFVVTAHCAVVTPDDGVTPADVAVRSDENNSVSDASLPSVTEHDQAYLLYTSGSTGKPKGVEVDHGAVADLVLSDPRLSVRPGDVVGHLAPTTFDASVFEIWIALCRGGTVEVMAEQGLTIEYLSAALRTIRPDWLLLTSGLFHLFAEHDLSALDGVGVLLVGGDVVAPRMAQAAASVVRTAFFAAYGLTEMSVITCLRKVEPGEELATVPLGSTLRGRTATVRDENLVELPPGEVGEIYLGGTGLARGYRNLPELTAHRFITHRGERLYRTGDRGRLLPSGELEFCGRVDRQVKIRGFRVEPGEIEVVLSGHPSVGAVAVDAPTAPDGNRRLVAYLVLNDKRAEAVIELRQWLSERLPGHLLPGCYLAVDELALDHNGKVDRNRLPVPWMSRATLGLGAPAAPETDTEQVIAEAIADELRIDQVGRHDDFFELGGDSLLAMGILDRIRSQGFEATVEQFFAHSSPAALAASLLSEATR